MRMLVFTGSTAAVSIQRPQVFRVTGRVWACASHVNHCVCWEPVVLHHWGADLWSFFTHWGVEENHHGPRQEQQNPLRVLLCFVCPPHPKWSLGLFHLSNTGSFVISRLEDSLTRGLLADWCCEAITSWKYGNFCLRNGVYEHPVLIRVPLFCRYYTREDTEDSVKYISGTILDDRPVRVDFDWGFQEGRQWGRGRSGGQVCCCTLKTYNEFLRSHSQWMLPLWIQSRTWWWQVCWPLHMCGMASCRFGTNTAQTMMLISSQLSGCCWLFCLGLLWEFTLEIMDKLRNSGQYMSERIDEMSDDWSTYIGPFFASLSNSLTLVECTERRVWKIGAKRAGSAAATGGIWATCSHGRTSVSSTKSQTKRQSIVLPFRFLCLYPTPKPAKMFATDRCHFCKLKFTFGFQLHCDLHTPSENHQESTCVLSKTLLNHSSSVF